jgi:G3E family GTPase
MSMLTSVAGDAMLRTKGIVDLAGEGPVALHAVQHQMYPPVRLPAWPAHWDGGGEAPGSRRSRIVFIVRQPLSRDYVASAFEHFASAPVG